MIAEGHSPAELRERAEAWFNRQIEILERVHGKNWPAHREWMEAYLREEIRQRLIARGWRPKK